jgi:hypothetical protein
MALLHRNPATERLPARPAQTTACSTNGGAGGIGCLMAERVAHHRHRQREDRAEQDAEGVVGIILRRERAPPRQPRAVPRAEPEEGQGHRAEIGVRRTEDILVADEGHREQAHHVPHRHHPEAQARHADVTADERRPHRRIPGDPTLAAQPESQRQARHHEQERQVCGRDGRRAKLEQAPGHLFRYSDGAAGSERLPAVRTRGRRAETFAAFPSSLHPPPAESSSPAPGSRPAA